MTCSLFASCNNQESIEVEIIPPSQENSSAPTPGNDGDLTLSDITGSQITINWDSTYDTGSNNADLEYRVLYSTSDNISTQETAEANGTMAMDWSNSINFTLTGLSEATLYYVNILTRDPAGNIAAYNSQGKYTRLDSGRIFHLDSSSQTAIPHGANVTQVDDFSVNGNHMTIANATMPQYYTNDLNGLPVIYSPIGSGAKTTTATNLNGVNDITIAAVHKIADPTNIVQLLLSAELVWYYDATDYIVGDQLYSFDLIGTVTTPPWDPLRYQLPCGLRATRDRRLHPHHHYHRWGSL